MDYKVTFKDDTSEIIDAPDKEIARAWAWENANYNDTRVKSIAKSK